MATKKPEQESEVITIKPRTCFVMMPIADHPDYESGHFNRVYQYLIKPACIKAGYQPIRADDNKASNMIMFDILKKIVECDMAICDLSSRNANVFYELGLRQAFNKKTILITDNILPAPFDISAFRYVSYSHSLRVDTVDREIPGIVNMLRETENQPADDVNSIIKLLQIQPSKVESIDLNKEESVIYGMLLNLQKQVSELKHTNPITIKNKYQNSKNTIDVKSIRNQFANTRLSTLMEFFPEIITDLNYYYDGNEIGIISSIDDDHITFNYKGHITILPNAPSITNEIYSE